VALIPFDDRDGQIWLDGVMVPWRDARLHVLSHGLHYASGVFEGERAYAGNIFKLRAHSERLLQSARILGFEIPYTAGEIDAACEQVVRANALTEAYVRRSPGAARSSYRFPPSIPGSIWPSPVGPGQICSGPTG
jgi:branched-chain amino acid aminotransferase